MSAIDSDPKHPQQHTQSRRLTRLLFIAGMIIAVIGTGYASLLKKKFYETHPLNNPADPKSTNYQGFRTTSSAQLLIVLNAAAVSNGTTRSVQLSNAGVRPQRYKISEDPDHAGVQWQEMPTTRMIQFFIGGAPGAHTIYCTYEMRSDLFERTTTTVHYNASFVNGGPPTVALTGVTSNQVFQAPATIPLGATATDDGGVTNVAFYNGLSLLANDFTSPYSFTWSSIPAGSYTISAVAYDNMGASSTNTIPVIVNAAPIIAITSPANFSKFIDTASITVSVTASDLDGTVTNVAFYYDMTNLVYNDTTTPFSYTTNALPRRWYTYKAVAYDNYGAAASNSIVIQVTNADTYIYYVSSSGNDNNSGTNTTAPVRMIQKAIYLSSNDYQTEIRIAEGTYLLGSGLTNIAHNGEIACMLLRHRSNFTLRGGYNSTYSGPGTATIIDGSGSSAQLFFGEALSNFVFERMDLKTGSATCGAGISISNAVSCLFTNISVRECSAPMGGGIALIGARSSQIFAQVYNNLFSPGDAWPRDMKGEGVYIKNSTNIIIAGLISNNVTGVGGGSTFGGGIYVEKGSNITLTADVCNNSISISYVCDLACGGGVFLDGGKQVTISGRVSGNTASSGGSSWHNNTFSCFGGGIYLSNTTGTTISGIVESNVTHAQDGYDTHPLNSCGGGIYLLNSTATISGIVRSNHALTGASAQTTNADGGGIYTNGSVPVISGSITANTPNNIGPNAPPTVTITGPANNSFHLEPANITITVNATDPDGSVTNVRFYFGTNFVGQDTTQPFSFTTNNVIAGRHTVSVTAYDNNGGSAIDSISFRVTNTNRGIYYISPFGNDNSSGTVPLSPFLTIQKAIDTSDGDADIEIRLAEGAYILGSGLTNLTFEGEDCGIILTNRDNVTIRGGYNSTFSGAGGTTLLDGSYSPERLLYAHTISNFRLEGIQLKTGSASYGAGIAISNAASLLFTNVVVHECSSPIGGGLALIGIRNSHIFAQVYDNLFSPADAWAREVKGEGIYIRDSSNVIIAGLISNNATGVGGGGTFGGGMYIEKASNISVTADIINNLVSISYICDLACGGGVFVESGKDVTISGRVAGNMAFAVGSSAHDNTFSCFGGGIYLSNTTRSTISGTVETNTTLAEDIYDTHPLNSYGGGIYILGGVNNTVSGIIQSNAAIIGATSQATQVKGGGLYITNTGSTITNGSFSSNLPNNIVHQ